MTTEKIQCEHCSSIVRKDNFKQHQRTKKCQKVQEEKRQREERERQEKEKEREEHSSVKESKEEKVQCKWCGSNVIAKNIKIHMKSKKCLSIRELKEPSNFYRCKWCKQCFPSQVELDSHRDVCIKGKIYHLKQELYIEKENRDDLIERHKIELKEQYKELRKEMNEREQELRKEMNEREQEFEKKLNEREQQFEQKLNEREEKFERELKSKDDFIKSLAKEPKYVTNTTNNNTFNLSNYFKGNNGIDFDEKQLENKIEQCRGMM